MFWGFASIYTSDQKDSQVRKSEFQLIGKSERPLAFNKQIGSTF